MWIEIERGYAKMKLYTSRPARALWIEILKEGKRTCGSRVEAREGLVD